MVAGEPARELRSVVGGAAIGGAADGGPDRTDAGRTERLARLRELAGDLSPLTLARDRRLPVLAGLESLLPGGLQRGATVSLQGPGATALTHAVLAGPTQAGSWAACVGADGLGWAAAAELGVALERVAVVRVDERRSATVLAALVDAFDLVVVGPEHRPDRREVRRLQSRARERGAVVVVRPHADPDGRWGADVRLECAAAEWSGPGQGWGHLRTRRVAVTVRGRRELDRRRRVDLWLPGPDGVVAVDGSDVGGSDGEREAATVVPIGRRQVG